MTGNAVEKEAESLRQAMFGSPFTTVLKHFVETPPVPLFLPGFVVFFR